MRWLALALCVYSAPAQTSLPDLKANARRLFAAGELERSAQEWKQAVAIAPEDLESRLNYGVALDALGRYGEANKLLTAAARQQATPQVLNNLAVNLVHLGRSAEAMKIFGQVLLVDPTNASALFNLGSLNIAAGNWARAVDVLTKLHQTSPAGSSVTGELAEAHLGYANELVRNGKLEDSLPYFQKALELAPDNTAAMVGLALALLKGNQQDQAISLLADANTRFARNLKLQLALGYAFESQSDWAQAREWYAKALETDPNSAMAGAGLGRTQMAAGDSSAGLKTLRAALRLNPQSAAANYELANALLLANSDDQEGLQLMERAAALAPDRAEPPYLLAKAALTKGDLAAAKRWARLSVEANTGFAAPHYLLSAIYRKEGNSKLSARELAAFQQLDLSRRTRENQELERALR